MLGFISSLMHKAQKSAYNKKKKAQKKAEDKIKKAQEADERAKREEELVNTITASEGESSPTDVPAESESSKITQKDVETAKKKPSKVGVLWTGLVARVTGFIEAIPITLVAIQIIAIVLVVAIIAIIIFSVISMIANSLLETIALEGAAFDWNNAYTSGFYAEEEIDEDGFWHTVIKVQKRSLGDDDEESETDLPELLSMDSIDFWCGLTDDTIELVADSITSNTQDWVLVANNLRTIRMAYRICYPDGSANLAERPTAMTPELILGMMNSEKGFAWMGTHYSWGDNATDAWYVVNGTGIKQVTDGNKYDYNVDKPGYAGCFTWNGWRDGPFSFSAYTPGMPEYAGVTFTPNALNKVLSNPRFAEMFAKLTGLTSAGHDEYEFSDYYRVNYGWAANYLSGSYTEGGTLSLKTSSSENPFVSENPEIRDVAQRNLFLSMFVTVCVFSEWYDPVTDTGKFVQDYAQAYQLAYDDFISAFGEATPAFKANVASALFYPNMHHLPAWGDYYDYYKSYEQYYIKDYRKGQLWLAASALHEASGYWQNIRHLSYIDTEDMQEDYDRGTLVLIPSVGSMHGAVAGTWFYYPAQTDEFQNYKPTYEEFLNSISDPTYSGRAYEPLNIGSLEGDTQLTTSLWNWLVYNSNCYLINRDNLLMPMVHSLGYGKNTHALAFEGMDALIAGGEIATRCMYITLGVLAGGVFDPSQWITNGGITYEGVPENAYVLTGQYRPIDGEGGYIEDESYNTIFPLPTDRGGLIFTAFTGKYPDSFNGGQPHSGIDMAGATVSPKSDWQTIESNLASLWNGSKSVTLADCQAKIGADLAGMCPVYAVADGYITYATWGTKTGYYYQDKNTKQWHSPGGDGVGENTGNSITIRSKYKLADGSYQEIFLQYMHLSLVSRLFWDPSNQCGFSNTCSVQYATSVSIPVKCGQIIGYASSTGMSTGVHLHIGNSSMTDDNTTDNGKQFSQIYFGGLVAQLYSKSEKVYPFCRKWYDALIESASAMAQYGNPNSDAWGCLDKIIGGLKE